MHLPTLLRVIKNSGMGWVFNERVLRQMRLPEDALLEKISRSFAYLTQPLNERDRIRVESIEKERSRLLENHLPLVDGTLGERGIYDKGTVRDACLVSKPPVPARWLYGLVRALQPQTVLELGTNVGISSAYLASALDGSGRVTTLESSRYRLRLAKEVHDNLGLQNLAYVMGLFQDVLAPTLESLGKVDLVFIDGHHQFEPTLQYLRQILPFASDETVFVMDDIRWSKGMKKVWAAIQADSRFDLVIDLHSVGVCVARGNRSVSHIFGPLYLF